MMNDILNKISSYNIFNYLFPGTLFAVIADTYSSYSIIQKDIFVAIFSYYFIGLVISRVGSLLIEPLLKKVGFLKFSEYKKFVEASKLDEKIDELSEVNNMYRTLCSLFVLLIVFIFFNEMSANYPVLKKSEPFIMFFSLLILFFFSYKKQTSYISARVNIVSDK